MIDQVNSLGKTLKAYSETRYFGPTVLRFLFSFVPFLLSCIVTAHLNAEGPYRVLLLLMMLMLLVWPALYWRSYYFTCILPTLKIAEIQAKYDLLEKDGSADFQSSLSRILDLIDTSLDREYSSKLLQKQAEFDAMKSQINPHFLYNTLDTIRGYALIEKAPVTADMIEALSRLFRYSISQKNPQITLRQELGILHDYIKIQEYRTNQHITFREDIGDNPALLDFKIPKLILQPFIENAIKHGMGGTQREFVIRLSITQTQSRIVISIADNGVGMSAEKLKELNLFLSTGVSEEKVQRPSPEKPEKGTGIALSNVNARIKLLYGDLYGVNAYSTPGRGSEFQITLPYQDM